MKVRPVFVAIWSAIAAACVAVLVWLGIRRQDDIVRLAINDRRRVAKEAREAEVEAARQAQGESDALARQAREAARAAADDGSSPYDLSGPAAAIARARAAAKAQD